MEGKAKFLLHHIKSRAEVLVAGLFVLKKGTAEQYEESSIEAIEKAAKGHEYSFNKHGYSMLERSL